MDELRYLKRLKGMPWVRLSLLPTAFVAGLTVATGCDRPAGDSPDGAVTMVANEVWSSGGKRELGGVLLTGPPRNGALAPNGLTAVADRGGATILLLGSDGTLARELGGRGFGPGEFQELDRVGFVGDTLLWATDNGNPWITWFDLRHRDSLWTVASPELQVPSTPWTAKAGWVLADGSVLGEPRGGNNPSGPDETPPIPLATWVPGGDIRIVDMIDNLAPRFRRVRRDNGLFMTTSQPLEGAPVIGIAQGGTWFYVLDRTPAPDNTGRMSISRYAPGGRQIGRVEVTYRPTQVDDSVMDWLRRQAEAFETQLPPSLGVDAEAILEATWVPERLPPARDAIADARGFWIQREMTSPGMWQRFRLDGDLRFETHLPDGFRGLAGDSSTLVGWSMDSMDTLGVPIVQRFHVAPPPAEGDGAPAASRRPQGSVP